MFAFLRSSEAGLSSDLPGIAHTENEKDLVDPAECVIAGLDSDSNVNPGGLTFEEGKSCSTTFSASQRFADKMLIPDTAGGTGRHLGVFSCTMLMYAPFLANLKPFLIENLFPASAVLLAQVSSLLHRLSLALSDLSAHPCYFGWLAFSSRSVGFLYGLSLVPCFRAPEVKRCTSKLYIVVQNTLQPLSFPRAPSSLVFPRATVL
jgi:hypothetical protein